MSCSRRLIHWWSFAVFLLCAPAVHYGRHAEALSTRMKRTVTHAQLMHDRGRVLQDLKRRMWLQQLLEELHTAETRDALGWGSGGVYTGGVDDGSTLRPKPTMGGAKNYLAWSQVDEEEGAALSQETRKDPPLKAANKRKRKRKGRTGRRRLREQRKRTARSLKQDPGRLPCPRLHRTLL
ncbi:parathyroid hormone-related protein-like [Megalops cyprinoides]|uniref:parathyroid hormone-related protein-like n=1 Tax=Megalops cyprinoides TaxID=118141 RepID=UPI001864238D|nr:parathyroid hormone-related protein-like [Megalops cyprinoides]